MGIFSALDTQKKTFNAGSPLGTWLANKLAHAGGGSNVDPDIPTVAATTDGIQDVGESTQTAGNMTLTVSVRAADGTEETFTTANILFDRTAAQIETIVDTAASGVITGWTNGDITVSGTALDNADNIVLTFDGTSVAGRPTTVVLVDVDGTGGAFGAITVTANGQFERAALGVLVALNVISGAVADQDAVTSTTSFTNSGDNNHNIPANVVKALMREAAAEDSNNATYHSIDAALWGPGEDRSPLVQERVTGDDTRPV